MEAMIRNHVPEIVYALRAKTVRVAQDNRTLSLSLSPRKSSFRNKPRSFRDRILGATAMGSELAMLGS